MVEGQGPMTPGNRQKCIGANSPAGFAEDEIVLENPCYAEVFFVEKRRKPCENRTAADLLAKAADGMFFE